MLKNFSLEISAKEADQIRKAAGMIPQGTEIYIPFLSGEDMDMRITAAKLIKNLGFVPVPSVAARRLRTKYELETFLGRLTAEVGIDKIFVIAGDLPKPEGPFEDALDVISSKILPKHGIKYVGISGYPQGHPNIDPRKLRKAMLDKHATLTKMGLNCFIISQFGFDSESMLNWSKEVRAEGIDVLIRFGIAGPTESHRLLSFAERCGVEKFDCDYNPEKILDRLILSYNPDLHGKLLLHFYPFGGFVKTAEWIVNYKANCDLGFKK